MNSCYRVWFELGGKVESLVIKDARGKQHAKSVVLEQLPSAKIGIVERLLKGVYK